MIDNDTILVRPMAEQDLDAGARLSQGAGWNQRRADWAFLYRANPAGCFVAERNGRVAGTVTAIDYGGKSGWIAMMLVEPSMRRQGVGSRLMAAAVEALGHCESIKLDATPAGKKVYDRLGFVDEYQFCRLTIPSVHPGDSPVSQRVRPMGDGDLDAVVALDAGWFGIERRVVIEGFRALAPEYALVAEEAGAIAGFALGRHGEHFEQIGPVMAAGVDTAKALARAAFARTAGKPVAVDALEHTLAWWKWLESLGFTKQRPFIRMYRGANPYPGTPRHIFAIAGPEVG
ncbi:MAG: GNAT family N-acetyltransferase [Candidatus Hydrogenedentes bacterium]|nr:GNAT family N-acetyltransferase [Candidatus Hydrogenedentota bacterium]